MLIALFLIAQIFRPTKEIVAVNKASDMLAITKAPPNIQSLIKNSCYDCHSYETVYPWYNNIAPVSWILHNHITEGRERLNFSKWDKYSYFKKEKLLRFAIKFVDKGEMPLWDYKLMHSKANLNDSQKQELLDWLKDIHTNLKK
jgi:hypothetical protein